MHGHHLLQSISKNQANDNDPRFGGTTAQMHFMNVCLYHKHHAGDTEGAPLFRATWAKILEGQKRAKRRVLFFFMIYIISGITSEGKAIKTICLLLLFKYFQPLHLE